MIDSNIGLVASISYLIFHHFDASVEDDVVEARERGSSFGKGNEVGVGSVIECLDFDCDIRACL